MDASNAFNPKDQLPPITVDNDREAIEHIHEAQILIDLGEYDTSIAYLNQISRQYQGDNEEVKARLLGGLARTHFKMGLNEKAIKLWEDALNSIANIDDYPYLESVFLNNMSSALINLGEIDRAQNNLMRSLEIYPLSETYQLLSNLVLDRDKDFELSEQYLSIGFNRLNEGTFDNNRKRIKYLQKLRRAYLIEGFGYHYYIKGERHLALEKYQEVLSIAEDLERVSLRIEMLKKIGNLYQEMEKPDLAAIYLSDYIQLNDSLGTIKNSMLSIPMRNFIEEEQGTPKPERTGASYIFLFLITISLVLFFVINGQGSNKKNIASVKPIEVPDKSNVVENSTPLTLPEDTEKEILKKLEQFEASKKFLDSNISLSILVGYVNSNSKYLREVLRRHRGRDYSNYINELRINYIIGKLKTNKKYLTYKISYLAKVSGFSSHSKFSASFKKVTGYVPSKFIKKIKKNDFD